MYHLWQALSSIGAFIPFESKSSTSPRQYNCSIMSMAPQDHGPEASIIRALRLHELSNYRAMLSCCEPQRSQQRSVKIRNDVSHGSNLHMLVAL